MPYLFVVAFFVLGAIAGTCAVHFDVTFWMAYLHHPVALPYLPCFVAAIFFGWPAIILAVVTWLVSFCL